MSVRCSASTGERFPRHLELARSRSGALPFTLVLDQIAQVFRRWNADGNDAVAGEQRGFASKESLVAPVVDEVRPVAAVVRDRVTVSLYLDRGVVARRALAADQELHPRVASDEDWRPGAAQPNRVPRIREHERRIAFGFPCAERDDLRFIV